MNLLLDIGNTSLRWGLSADGQLGPMGAVRHARAVPPDLLAAWESLDRPTRVYAGNVGGAPVAQAVARAVRAFWGLEIVFVTTRRDCLGLRVAYAEPTRLGVDRWLALLGAAGRAGAGRGVVILDAGTAATVDVLAPGGQHLGGLIVPGLAMMREALLAGTHIPGGEPEPVGEPWAADTAAGVAAGARHALAALGERAHQRLWQRLGDGAGVTSDAAPLLLVTGGDGPLVVPLIERPCELVPELVLRGLVRLSGALGRCCTPAACE